MSVQDRTSLCTGCTGTEATAARTTGWHLAAYFGELCGTAGLVFAALTAISFSMPPGAPLGSWPLHAKLLLIGLAVGGAVALFASTALGDVSGAHLNPAISLYMFVRGRLQAHDLIGFCVFQLAGSLLGVYLARGVWGGRVSAAQDGLIQPGPGWNSPAVFAGEALSTAALVIVLALMTQKPRPRSTPLVIGALITVLIFSTGAASGASFNPARNFGPHVISQNYSFFWIYMIAPLVGALAVAGVDGIAARVARVRADRAAPRP
jgi:glycerol uptake facilitator protein/aquaporin Z